MMADADWVSDEWGNAAPGPDFASEAYGFRALLQQVHKLRTLVWSQQRLRAWSRVVAQGLNAGLRGPFQPLADCALGDAQGVGDARLRPSLLVKLPGTMTATFTPTNERLGICCVHDAEGSRSWSTIIRSLCSYL